MKAAQKHKKGNLYSKVEFRGHTWVNCNI